MRFAVEHYPYLIVEAVQLGDPATAERLCQEYLDIGGGADAHYLLAGIEMGRDDPASAIPHLEAVLAEMPKHREAWSTLGLAREKLGDAEGAVAAYTVLLQRWPGDAETFFHRATLNFGLRRWQEAENDFAVLLALNPGHAPGWVNRGMMEMETGRYPQAEASFRRAIAADPENRAAPFNLALLLLLTSRWQDGFAAYESRLAMPEAPDPGFTEPLWTGREPASTRVLLWNDQGLGDAVLFLRYARDVAACGHHVIAYVADTLTGIAAGVAGVAEAVGLSGPPPAFDVQISFGSLPHVLGVTGPQAVDAYLPVPRQPAAARRIGLVWAGSGKNPKRSAALADLAALFAVPGIEWVSLQVGDAAAEADAYPAIDRSLVLPDLRATAEAMAGLDTVVTVDTVVAHIAGAMGIPALVMLPHPCRDWRWGDAGETSPWYKSLRVVRQTIPRDWRSVAARVAALLQG